jgi:hypothetical protein
MASTPLLNAGEPVADYTAPHGYVEQNADLESLPGMTI